MKTIRIKLFLLTLALCFSATLAMSQTKFVAKMQAPLKWEHYRATWQKEEKKAIKQSIAATKELNKAPKGRDRRNANLAKLRNRLSEVAARKEGNDE